MDIIITNSGEIPIYQQIADQIKGAILRGDLASEQPLPSIRVLAKELKISVITTKRAYEELEREGLIYTVRGKGSFVAAQGEHRLEESKQRLAEEKLKEAIEMAKMMGLGRGELRTIFERLLEGEEWNRF
ncbi:MAG: GntR family transcriptional regulator [Firmicutes bacterium]|nr:GntR family transcriptional regulator [Bacillota bacterium]